MITLKKASPYIWDSLWAEGISREEIMRRREEDVAEVERMAKERYEVQKKTRHGNFYS